MSLTYLLRLVLKLRPIRQTAREPSIYLLGLNTFRYCSTHYLTNLKWKDDHENSLLSVREDVLDEGPPGSDQHDGEEEQGTLQQMGDVVQHSPENKCVGS